MTNPAIRVTELDFATIKENFKTFLSQQSEFQDYNFEGSGMTILLDILAYNTHYNSILANFMTNEMFLDTAIKRESILSHAKSLGYVAKSAKSAMSTITGKLGVVNGNPSTMSMVKGTPFLTAIGNKNYQFVTVDDHLLTIDVNDEYPFEVEVYEGNLHSNAFIISNGAKYILPNKNVDFSSIRCVVTTNNVNIVYTMCNNFLVLDENSNTFFVNETYDNKTELYFGDGKFGTMPSAGSTLVVTYVTTKGSVANGAKAFIFGGSIQGKSNVTISSVITAEGGDDAETNDEIRFHAPLIYSSQNRAVTLDDYKAIVKMNFNNVSSINVWGGEDAVPPQFGKVFMCIRPKFGEQLTTVEEDSIRAIMASRSVANVGIVFDPPNYIDVVINTVVSYDNNQLDVDVNSLRTLVIDQILSFSDAEIGLNFGSDMKYSKLTRYIDNSHRAITSNLTGITIMRKIVPQLHVNKPLTINFFNPLENDERVSIFSTSGFFISTSAEKVYLEDDNAGKIRLFSYRDGKKIILNTEQGTINYGNGIIIISPLRITQYDQPSIRFYARPQYNDVFSDKNNLVRITSDNITVSFKKE